MRLRPAAAHFSLLRRKSAPLVTALATIGILALIARTMYLSPPMLDALTAGAAAPACVLWVEGKGER